jgi:hypothetical protein
MNDLERQVARLRRRMQLITWVIALGAAFDLWEFVRLVNVIRSAWGQP